MVRIFFFLLVFFYYLTCNSQIITTICGTGGAGYSGDGGAATSATLNQTVGVALDGSGNIYITDYGNNVVRKVTAATGIISTVAGNGIGGYSGDGAAATSARLNGPEVLAVDASGNLFINDANNSCIRKVTIATGIITTIAGTGGAGYNGDGIAATAAQLNYPQGVGIDASGNIYIADQSNYRIRKVNAATGLISTIAGTGAGGYSGDGGAATAATLNQPAAVDVDVSGNVYIADYGNNVIRKVTVATGIITTVAGTSGGYSGDGGAATSAQLNQPYGINVYGSGDMLIADYANNVIRRVLASTGIISTVAGNGAAGYSGDGGLATSANLRNPLQVAWYSGDIYIADWLNNVIRKVTSVPLPVELLYFNASVNNNRTVKFEWSTAMESNNKMFTIEKTIDSQTYQIITSVPASGNSSTEKKYSAIDYDPDEGISYYRLKQTDFDGKSTYSSLVSVNNGNNSSLLNIFPNPSKGLFTIQSSKEIVSFEIYNALGETILSSLVFSPVVNISGRPKGIYFLKICTRDAVLNEKVVIE